MILGASFDSPEANARFARKYAFQFPLLCDESREIGIAYGACESADAPTASRISYWIGPDGRIRASYPKVSPASHPAEVLQEIEGGSSPDATAVPGGR